ncbi:hypothetical protein HDU92_005551 [Lobulomyces angularis]|nr:hypothetical protein HDU92_005551 [Lobulomyces angularis]
MNFLKPASLLLLLSTALAAPSATTGVENQYIIKLRSEVAALSGDVLDSHLSWLDEVLLKHADANSLLPGTKSVVLHKYGNLGSGFTGYALKASNAVLEEIRQNSQVEYVEADAIATAIGWPTPKPTTTSTATATSTKPASSTVTSTPTPGPSDVTWGLDRVDQRNLPLNSQYNPSGNGAGITVYVVDTGITAGHPQFEGRASEGAYFVENDAKDGNGHGTHCAGSVASKDYGVAKAAKVVGVKVLGANGSGSYSGVIAGINWVAQQATAGKSVASMSLGGGKSQAVDDAVNAAVAKNIPFAVAAGNSNGVDACNASPAGASGAFTVAASDKNDKKASFSDIGPCVEIVAPGVDITSTWINNGLKTISGTSMATPHVAGGFAALLSQQSFSSAQAAYDALLAKSTPGKITGLPANTANKLLYVGA